MANDITVGGEPMFTDRRGVMGLEFDSKVSAITDMQHYIGK